jgi:flagellin-like hook-associated protein FlgL
MSGTPDVFTLINQLKQQVQAGDVTGISGNLANITASINNVSSIQAQLGGETDRTTAISTMLTNSQTSLSQSLSNIEDVNTAQATINLQTDENVYTAAISTAKSVLSLSLTTYF